jgi:hypothetical protein
VKALCQASMWLQACDVMLSGQACAMFCIRANHMPQRSAKLDIGTFLYQTTSSSCTRPAPSSALQPLTLTTSLM